MFPSRASNAKRNKTFPAATDDYENEIIRQHRHDLDMDDVGRNDVVDLIAVERELDKLFIPSSRRGSLIAQDSDQATSHAIEVRNEADKLRLSFDVHQFKKADLRVNITDNVLTVEAFATTTPEAAGSAGDQAAGSGKTLSKFCKRFLLPKEIDLDSITSVLSADGILNIVANKTPLQNLFARSRRVSIRPAE